MATTLSYSELNTDVSAGDYWQLLKPRVMSLVVFTGLIGLLLAPGTIHPVIACAAILCIAVGSGAAGAINMWFDRDIDSIMERTQDRPLPRGTIQPGEALGFGITLATGSVIVMYTLVNFWAAFYLAIAILFYVFVYTIWLKRSTPQNIVIGGAAGAFPPVIGWVAVTGETTLLPWLLFGIIFIWTPPHFWALALSKSEDYKRANIPMLPVTSGQEATKTQIFLYSIALLVLSLIPVVFGYFSWVYGSSALLLGSLFLILAIQLKLSKESQRGMSLFVYSIFYLFFLFAAMIGDRFIL